MFDLLKAIWDGGKKFVNDKATNAAAAFSKRKWPDFFKEFGLMLILMFVPAFSVVLLLMAAYQWRKFLLALAIIPICIASYRANHPSNAKIFDQSNKVDEELARQRAQELYPFVLALMFQTLVAVSSFTIVDRKHGIHEIETATYNGNHFYMDGAVPIYQFELDLKDEVNQEQADHLRDKLQEYGQKYISDYPMLISSDSRGRSALEVLAVHSLGHRICVDVVLTTAASIPIIDARRRARAVRKNFTGEVPRYIDKDYGEE